LGSVTPVLRGRYSHAAWRARVWIAADEEVVIKCDLATPYNPSDDCRVKWLLQWCDVLEGSRRAIDERLTATCDFLCRIPAPVSGKQRAAGETLTLAQGS
jgi:hypothetical protein